MYDVSVIDSIIEDAKKIVSYRRSKYDKLMKVIQFFISEHDIIVNNMSDYFFDLYTSDMFNLPFKLTDLLYESDPIVAKYVTLEIKIYKYHYIMSIDGIQFVHFNYINAEIRKNILPYTCSMNCKCFGPEILLINIYANMVNPNLYKSWRELYNTEESMSTDIINQFSKKITGGSRIIQKNNLINQMYNIYSTSLCSKPYNFEIDIDYNDLLLKHYIKDSVIIGQIAVNIYKNIEKIGRIQVITEKTFSEEIQILKGLLGNSISYSINNLKVPTNLNLHKMTIFYNNKAIMDIYDAGNYELIPYNIVEFKKMNVKLGTPFVILRFILIDIWSTLYGMNTNILSKDIALSVVHRLIIDYIDIRILINTMKISDIFSLKYIGIYEDIHLNKMRVAFRLKKNYIQPYIPYQKKLNSSVIINE